MKTVIQALAPLFRSPTNSAPALRGWAVTNFVRRTPLSSLARLFALLVVAASVPASGQGPVERLPTPPTGVQTGDWTGVSVAIDAIGTTAVVGSRYATVDGNVNAGRVDVYTKGTLSNDPWVHSQTLVVPDAVPDAGPGQQVGCSVAISGDTIVAGAVGDSHGDPATLLAAGAAYVFTKTSNGWGTGVRLEATAPGFLSFFGFSVAISGGTIVVGAYNDIRGVEGAAYVFEWGGGGWSLSQRLSDHIYGTDFGFAVAIDADTIVVGAHATYRGGLRSAGDVFVFVRSTPTNPCGALGIWCPQATLHPEVPSYGGGAVGYAVAISGDTAFVGAIDYTTTPLQRVAGAVYVFERSTDGSWSSTPTPLQASGLQNGAIFGCSIALSGDNAIIGAIETEGASQAIGGAYVFSKSCGTWAQRGGKILATDPAVSALFGFSVAIAGETAIVGAPQADAPTLADTGAAYAVDFSGFCDSIDFNRDGVSPDSLDTDDYLSVFGGGPCSTDPNCCGDIDFNNDGVAPDAEDIDAYLRVLAGGEC